MYTKVYNDAGNSVVLTDGNIVYTLEYNNGSLNLYSGSGDSKVEIEFDEDEPLNRLKYINIKLVNNSDNDILMSNIIDSVESSEVIDESCEIVFPYINYRFKDGSRENIYFCVTKSVDYKYNVKIDYFVNESTSKVAQIDYNIKPSFKSITSNVTNYIIRPLGEDVTIELAKSCNDGFYCVAGTRNLTISNSTAKYDVKSHVNGNLPMFVDEFDTNCTDNLYFIYSQSKESPNEGEIVKIIGGIKSAQKTGNNVQFGQYDVNGETLLYKKVLSSNNDIDTIYYTYYCTCIVEKCMPKICVNIKKNNIDDMDYVVAKNDRSENLYGIQNGTKVFSKSLSLFKDYSAVSTNVYDNPKYDAKVSAYIPKSLMDEGYALGTNSVVIGRGTNIVTLEGINDIEDHYDTNYGYSYKTQTFKVNYDTNIPDMSYIYNNISSTNNITKNETYYIKSKDCDYLDYGEDSININDDTRIVYRGI